LLHVIYQKLPFFFLFSGRWLTLVAGAGLDSTESRCRLSPLAGARVFKAVQLERNACTTKTTPAHHARRGTGRRGAVAA
jgi:hypothetical protein